jgi:hypothetical protein
MTMRLLDPVLLFVCVSIALALAELFYGFLRLRGSADAAIHRAWRGFAIGGGLSIALIVLFVVGTQLSLGFPKQVLMSLIMAQTVFWAGPLLLWSDVVAYEILCALRYANARNVLTGQLKWLGRGLLVFYLIIIAAGTYVIFEIWQK